jgi:putative ABC transport system permease protein
VGASVSRITVLLSKEFVHWVVLANFIAWPIAYFAMDKWLQNFAVRIDQSFILFLSSALLAFVIAIITVSVLSVKAASASPIKALRCDQ